jgi:chemotaxis methyl-accepting protein methylase
VVHARSSAEAQQRLERCPELLPGLLSTLLIGVTEFLRDPAVFAFLAAEGLARVETRPGNSLHAVSLGCSDGRELYSVAFLLAERGLLDRSVLTGVDCRTAALAAAHAGWYEPSALDAVPVAWRARYFSPEGSGYRIAPRLRARARWRRHDVCTTALPAADIILCRNLLIYLERAAAAELWRSVVGALAPGGLLVTGRAERPPLELKLTRLAPCIYTKE